MNIRNSLILIAAFLLISLIPATVPGQTCIPVPSGAVSWWSAESDGNDRFGRNNTVVLGDTLFVTGMVGQAFSFDGSGDYAQAAATSALPVGAAPRTVELWFRAPATPGESGLFQYGTAAGGQMFGLITSGNAPGRLYFYGHSADLPANTVIAANTWYHGAVTYDGSTVKIYINGQLENQAPMALNTVIDSNGITIGHRAGGSFWNGQIDEPTLYDRALSDAEIAAIYNAGSAGKCVAQCSPVPNGAIGWWPANGNSSDIIKGNNGTLVNGVTYAGGKVDQAFNFTQPSQQYVDLSAGAPSYLLSNTAGSISAWVNNSPVAASQFNMVAAFGSGNAGEAVGFGIHNGNVRVYHHTDALDWQTGVPVAVGTWTLITYTWDGTTERLYKDGSLAANRPRNFNYVPGNARVGFGFINDASVFFNGRIDELAIFDRTLDPAEVSAMFNADSAGMCPHCASPAAGLVSWWPGENNGSDIVGTHNGTLENGVAFAGGKVGRAFNMDGVDDKVTIPAFDMGSDWTVEGWVDPIACTDSLGNCPIFTRSNSNQDGLVLVYFGSGHPLAGQFAFDIGNGSEWQLTLYSGTTYAAAGWHHIAAVKTGDTYTLFVDGIQKAQQTAGGISTNYQSRNIVLGNWNYGSAAYLRGLIDDISVYNTGLSSVDILKIFNAGKAGKCNSCAPQSNGAISWWRGEDNVHDAVGGNYGVLLGGATFAPGKVGRAFSFNGSTAAVRIPDSPTLDVTTEFTLGAWVKPASIPNYPNAALVISKIGPVGNLNGYQLTVSNISGTNRIWCGFNTGGNNWPQHVATGGSVPAGEWTYIACTYDHNTLAVHQNGEQVGSNAVGPLTVANTTSNVKLGSDDVAQQFYSGLIDEPMIYGRALTATELRSVYDAGSLGVCPAATPLTPSCAAIPPGMISWWRGENNPLDRRKANPGTLWGTTAFSPGKVGKGFGFAAGNEAVDVGTWFDRQVFSVEMWVKPNNGQIQYANIIDNYHYSSPLRSWVLEDLNTGNIFQWYSADFPAGTNILFELVPDTWQHIVITRDANRVTRGYLNRSLVGTVTTSVDIPYDGTQHLRIGNWYGGNRAFNGTIDEVTIYNRALSEAEIAALYNADSYGKCVGTQTMADMDGDMLSDLAIFRPSGASGAEWWWLKSSGGNGAVQFGSANDAVVTADYTGDGKTDIAYWQPSTGFWYVLRSEDLTYYAFPFGGSGDVPVPADYDGDGRADAAVFRASNTTWYISRTTGGTGIVQFGLTGDKPVVDDYDGDGKADIAVFRPNGTGGAEWWIMQSSGGVFATQFGQPTDKAVPADYTGDGRADIAFWQPATGYWFVLRSDDYSYYAFPFGAAGDMPVPADYDGDAKTDAAVYRPTTSNWFISRSKDGLLIRQFGSAGDVPVPSAFVR